MNATRLFQPLLIAALLGSLTAHAAQSTIAIALEDGKQVATFKVGDSRCILKDDQIRCTPTR
jgi:serine/threonine protein phosphatase PrpC